VGIFSFSISLSPSLFLNHLISLIPPPPYSPLVNSDTSIIFPSREMRGPLVPPHYVLSLFLLNMFDGCRGPPQLKFPPSPAFLQAFNSAEG